jgi:hypothetical protein
MPSSWNDLRLLAGVPFVQALEGVWKDERAREASLRVDAANPNIVAAVATPSVAVASTKI